MPVRRPRTLVAILLLVALTATACGTAAGGATPDAPGFTRLTAADLTAGDAVPAPTGDVVLTITGAITTHNAAEALELDLATLERIGMVEYAVDDRQALGRRVTFQGILLRDLLAVAGIQGSATTLGMTALNDYAVDVPVQDAIDLPVLLATRADQQRMPVAEYGPTRIVYPYRSHDLEPVLYDPRWIWQLASIDVR